MAVSLLKCWHAGRIEDLPTSSFERLMTINYLGVVHSVKAVLPSMLQQHSGHISFVSSSMGLIGVLYCGHTRGAPVFLQHLFWLV